MMQLRGLLVLSLLVVIFAACQKKNNNTPIPQISLITVIADSITVGNPEDTILIAFDYFDGDGNLGTDPNKSLVVLKDNRPDLLEDSLVFVFPSVADEVVDPLNGLRGKAYVFMYGSRVVLRSDSLHQAAGDTVKYKMHIVDNAGNKSNTVDLPEIRLFP